MANKTIPKIVPTVDLSLTKTEVRLIRGLEAQQTLLQRQLAEVQSEGDEVLAEIEQRLNLKPGAFARNEYGINVLEQVVVPTSNLLEEADGSKVES